MPSNFVDLLVLYAMDLLAQTEAQHRTLCQTQGHLATLKAAADAGTAPAFQASEARDRQLAAVTADVQRLIGGIHNQQALLRDMEQALAGVQIGT